MRKAKKIVLIVLVSLFSLIAVLVILFFCALADQPRVALMSLSARHTAAEYCREKYGDAPRVIETSPIYSGGFMFDRGSLDGIKVSYEGFDVVVCGEVVMDNRQYEEITAAFAEKYLNNADLYSELTERKVSLLYSGEDYIGDRFRTFTRVCFSGDIDEFLTAAKPQVDVSLSGMGRAGENESAPGLLREMLERIAGSCPAEYRIYAEVFDPLLSLPEMPNKADTGSLINPPNTYERYMELMTYGQASFRDGKALLTVRQPRFYEIDGYTAISDDDVDAPITSMQQVFFSQKDYSDNLTAYRGRYKYDNHAEENILTIRSSGISVGIAEKNHDFLLRLDREHYGITDSTVALRVTDTLTDTKWAGKRLYTSFGFYPYDCDYETWYYIDDEYLYLYVPSLCSDLFGFEDRDIVQIAFADIEGYKTTP